MSAKPSRVPSHRSQSTLLTYVSNRITASLPGQPGKPASEKYFNEAQDDGVAVASAGPHDNQMHLALDR